ncbi:hypothetical protein [Clostridium estertheticum]|uniref:Uncharacterized protein n=1 Tax=Clostridium estertheticum TaxID=238834 RepID=A0A7Y3SZL5_9CLOT|nr:hypothetical protein [Clostridium estertheticum]MBW9173206.1 hypothetical protein [Clostridium estertheticum]NNU78306.1 hypothetical protein [Clostridium estertheticum]
MACVIYSVNFKFNIIKYNAAAAALCNKTVSIFFISLINAITILIKITE